VGFALKGADMSADVVYRKVLALKDDLAGMEARLGSDFTREEVDEISLRLALLRAEAEGLEAKAPEGGNDA
jgi:uncharacterized small protein (DUF1192 family)